VSAGIALDTAAVKVILASASPRRKELLELAGVQCSVRPANIDESQRPGESATTYTVRLAEEKAATVTDDGPVLAADTVVVVDGEFLGKPTDRGDARRMLRLLSATTHQVVTGFHLRCKERRLSRAVSTDVEFRAIDEAELERYLATDEWRDKAGAYAIQGAASAFVRQIRGSYTSVVGLPLCEVVEALAQLVDA
jgi:septum formation protein